MLVWRAFVLSLFTKFEALSDDVTVAIPVCINKSMIASHTSLASNLFSGYTAGHHVQLSMIQRQYLWLLDDGGSMGPIQSIVMCWKGSSAQGIGDMGTLLVATLRLRCWNDLQEMQ